MYLHHKYPSICLSIITPFYGFPPPNCHTSQPVWKCFKTTPKLGAILVGKPLCTFGLPIWHTLSHLPSQYIGTGPAFISFEKKKQKSRWHTPPLLSKNHPKVPQSATPFWLFSFKKLLKKTITFSELKTPPGGIDQQRNNFEECPVETNSLDNDVMKRNQREIQTWSAS